MEEKKVKDPLERISITLPSSTLTALDQMARKRGFGNRSLMLSQIIYKELTEFQQVDGDELMTGTITLFYSDHNYQLGTQLTTIKREYIAEVISSLHVQLEQDHTMEILVVQGPANVLRSLSDRLMSCRGVKTGNLNLNSVLIPQVHARRSME